MKKYILEVCVDSVESALAAVEGGATRLELCGNLIIGGTTPSPGLFREIRRYTDIPIHILIRPRFGDFLYTDYEFNVMKEDVKTFKELGAEGMVAGILKADGTLNTEQLRELMIQAEGMPVTLHRAFDVCANPCEALEQAVELGIKTILTSGQADICLNGAGLIRELIHCGKGRIEIMAGGGVDASIIRQLYPITRASVYHMSGKAVQDSPMQFRKKGVNMGFASISEYEIWRTDASRIREAVQALEEL